MKQHNRFAKGSGVYICEECGKRTRETGQDESNYNLCAYCLLEVELENSLSDGAITQEIFNEEIINLKKEYNR